MTRDLYIRVSRVGYLGCWCNVCRFRLRSDGASFALLLTQVRYQVACIMNCRCLVWLYCFLSGCYSFDSGRHIFAAEVLEPRHRTVRAPERDFLELAPIQAPINVKTSCDCRNN